MDTAGKPHSADENIRRLRKLQQDAQLAFREQITRHRAEVVARQNDFRENFPPPMAASARPAPPESDPDEIAGPAEISEPSAPTESDGAFSDLVFLEEATKMPASLAPEDALQEDALPEEKTDHPETVRSPSRVESDRLARRRGHRMRTRRTPPATMRTRERAEPEPDHPAPKATSAPPPSEPEEELSVEEQKVLDEIEIFEALWQKKDASKTPPPSPPSSQTAKKSRSFFDGIFDLSPQFSDDRTDGGED
ncbi:hypothetical protein [uncultured Sneathiella sp.]|uniref:hypothetical protein n=1 Tax=uncultured Sneathiella sp. TaxID=879315 RepID=UPI0030DB993A|tara:strand:- start:3896 stop:4648 length:753 start_codon:yes stop_codon:yes gene_type:complete